MQPPSHAGHFAGHHLRLVAHDRLGRRVPA